MRMGLAGLVTVLFVAGSSLSYGEEASEPRISQADMKVLTDVRIDMLRGALRLTPEQVKLWPAVEEAIRNTAETRYHQMTTVATTAERIAQGREVDPIELLRNRVSALTQRGTELKKLVDAWQPLYLSLSAGQKQRARRAIKAAFT
jgi:hypothetical protein